MAKFDKVIPPGQEGKVELAIDGKKVSGHFSKAAGVFSNDPENKQVTLTIMGEEIPYLSVSPAGTVSLQGIYGQPAQTKLTLGTNEEDLDDFTVTKITSNIDDKISYSLAPSVKPHEFELKLYKNPRMPTSSTYGMVYVHTNSTREPKSEIQVYVMTKGNIIVSPITLNFGAVRFGDAAAAGAPVTKSVLASKSNGEFAITDITVDNPNYTADIDPVMEGKQYRVQVTFRPPMKRETRQNEMGEMIIHTNDPLEPAVRVVLVARAM